jgi:hypothetical protein
MGTNNPFTIFQESSSLEIQSALITRCSLFLRIIKTNESSMTNRNDYPSAAAVAIIDSSTDDNVYASAHLLLANNIHSTDAGIILVTDAISIPLDLWDKTVTNNNSEAMPPTRPRTRYETPLCTMPAVLVADRQEKKARRRKRRRVNMALCFTGGTFVGGIFLGPIGLALGGVGCAAISRTASKIGERRKDRRVKVLLLAQYNESITENNNLSEQELVLRPSAWASPNRN